MYLKKNLFDLGSSAARCKSSSLFLAPHEIKELLYFFVLSRTSQHLVFHKNFAHFCTEFLPVARRNFSLAPFRVHFFGFTS